jgi:UDP-glucose 4-epimerase
MKDVISGVIAAPDQSGRYRLFNLGTGQGTSLTQLLHVIEGVTEIADQVGYFPSRLVDVSANGLDAS